MAVTRRVVARLLCAAVVGLGLSATAATTTVALHPRPVVAHLDRAVDDVGAAAQHSSVALRHALGRHLPVQRGLALLPVLAVVTAGVAALLRRRRAAATDTASLGPAAARAPPFVLDF